MIDSRSKLRGIKPSFLMRKLLVPLLAAIALPTAVNAESYSLVMTMYQRCTGNPSCAS